MLVRTKTGDNGMTDFPVGGSPCRVHKGNPMFEVLGEIDQLDHQLQVCVMHGRGLLWRSQSSPDTLDELMPIVEIFLYRRINEVRALYKQLLSGAGYCDTGVLEEEAQTHIEPAYKRLSGTDLKADLDMILSHPLSLGLNQARLYARRLERVYVRAKGDFLGLDLILSYINALSDWLYETALLCDLLEKKRREP